MNAVSGSITSQTTDIGLLAWLNQAEPGDAIEYHRGFLGLDRWRESSALSEGDRQAVCRLANLAMRLSDRGLIDLVQRRIRPDCFSYIASARPRPNSPPLSLLTVAFKETV
jgi:hypothetical protein